jgi:hypothetical protein
MVSRLFTRLLLLRSLWRSNFTKQLPSGTKPEGSFFFTPLCVYTTPGPSGHPLLKERALGQISAAEVAEGFVGIRQFGVVPAQCVTMEWLCGDDE